MFEERLEKVISGFSFGYFLKFKEKKNKPEDQLTHIFSEDRPSIFEQFIHIADICTQVWNINIGWEAWKMVQKLFNKLMSASQLIQYKKILDDNLFYIDTKSPNYMSAVDPHFEFKIPRLGENLYKFIKE